jgi:hypothetical protein
LPDGTAAVQSILGHDSLSLFLSLQAPLPFGQSTIGCAATFETGLRT